ncbi:tyrosine--tRNA ligase [Candidatus Erwinia haradaeae]|uniref:Tyrosine--tRNA ligase n=1 Tax=Candidatus Erwinia haradaeae TaxID=1922217 RepID=A0A451D4B5_9GAMM|nr:tyrosine--tRNA ligase [Candidatus Erwinia haradaeae]VFP80530.1 Tyrosine--tRNA ligase [Candidatus Erwinia haradaeae]
MPSSNLIKKLEERGLIHQITDKNSLQKQLEQKTVTLYCGLDPTADSLHVGHLVPLLFLKKFQNVGHKPIILLGGATGLIGDPSFKTNERMLCDALDIARWTEVIHRQLAHFLDFHCKNNNAIVVNNYEWFHTMSMIKFLRNIGKYFSINQMINKEAVRKRLHRNHQGISFTEFSYNLLQAYDFTYLNKHHNVILQIGGSDQWGNIISGIDLTRRINQQQVFGITLPLLTKSDGTKFGKTEDETIWLDAKKTSPYKFYQFWMSTADSDVYRFLKIFTSMSIHDIQELQNEDKSRDHAPSAQKILAELVTELVHGYKGLSAARRITRSLFSGHIKELTEEDIKKILEDGVENIIFKESKDLQQALVSSLLATSRSHARKLIASKSINVNGHLQTNSEHIFCPSDKLFNKYTFLCRGKKHYVVITWLK